VDEKGECSRCGMVIVDSWCWLVIVNCCVWLFAVEGKNDFFSGIVVSVFSN